MSFKSLVRKEINQENTVMHRRGGFALEATMFVMILMTVLMLSAYSAALSTTRASNLDYRAAQVAYAAEGGADAILAQLADALEDGLLEDGELASVQPPEMEGFSFSRTNVRKIGGVVIETVTDGPFAGLYSLTQHIEITSEATDPFGNTSAVVVAAKAQAFPIFQFGVFFEKDLEATNGPSMTFAGWVHSNGNIYLSSNNAWYRDMITTPNKIFHDRKDNHSVKNGVWIADAGGRDVKLLFDSRTHPSPVAFRARSNTDFDNRLKTDAYDVDSLKLPMPEGVDAYELLRPRDPGDGQLERAAKFSWKADFYAVIDMEDLNPGQGNPTAELCARMTIQRPGAKSAPSQAQCMQIFDFSWGTFWESRERRYVDVLDIDVGELFAWTGADPALITNILYVTFVNVAQGRDPSGDGIFPVVRLVNGRALGNPITIATDRPLYVQGDYNTDGWQPASFVGDAISLLSNSWNDRDHEDPTIVRPNASNTTFYGAILAGHSATPCDHEDVGCPGGYTDFYGGGIENYPRFLESWSNRTLKYVGALVSIHISQHAVGTWSGRPYRPPRRDWSFDVRFENPQNLPPGTPVVGNIIHTAFRPVY
ncbi:MAG: hypothetical protein IIA55_12730 [Gemmatimonadetes bacterium]|nr:hypothetical protein [Gemmatimonadota bacterium]